MTHAFLSTRIVTPGGTRAGALLVESGDDAGRAGRIRAICGMSEIPSGAVLHQCGEDALLPGLVDTHVHINEPGRTEWEGFWTATRAAAAGGFTTLVDMPLNCLPETTTVEALGAKRRAAAGQCFVDWAAWGGVVANNQRHIVPLVRAGVPGFKCFLIYPGCDGFTMVDRAQLEAALPDIAESGLPLLVHAELAGPVEEVCQLLEERGADWRAYSTYLASRPDVAELEAIEMLLALCRKYRFHLHIVHLSSALALPELARARAEGLRVTVETCPHYLHFAAEEIEDGATLLKCAPPIRGRENREALWEGLREGVIDLIATDHSPCPPQMKRLESGRFDQAWGGIAGLSAALSVVYTDSFRRGYSLEDVVRWMSTAPAALAGISDRAGELAPGREANFIVFDTEAVGALGADQLHQRHAISPYVGEMLRGKVKATYLRGERVWDGSSFEIHPRGRELSLLQGVLTRWNVLDAHAAAEEILPCCGSSAWAEELVAQRPFSDEQSILKASLRIWLSLPDTDWHEAFASHPRIGESKARGSATATALLWSTSEQSAAMGAEEREKTALREANARYEQRFGRIFLVCARGRSAREILGQIERRLRNTPEAELFETALQQGQITELRLKQWLGES